jgi:hypothetical protein
MKDVFGLWTRIRKWTRKAFMWECKRTANKFEFRQFFWLATDGKRPYSWRMIESRFGFRGKPLNLKNWR